MTRQKSAEHYKCRRGGSVGQMAVSAASALCVWSVYGRRDSICVRILITLFFRSEVAQSDFVPCVGQGVTVFVSIIPKYIDALVQYRHEVKRSVTVQIWILHSLSQTTISTSSLLWNRRPLTFCFIDEEVETAVRKWLRLISPTSTAKFLNSCQVL
jgi:hypothetical protein